jgi:hypothetical protein
MNSDKHFVRIFESRVALSAVYGFFEDGIIGIRAIRIGFGNDSLFFLTEGGRSSLIISEEIPNNLVSYKMTDLSEKYFSSIVGKRMYMFWIMENNLNVIDGISIEFSVEGPTDNPIMLEIIAKADLLDIYVSAAIDI